MPHDADRPTANAPSRTLQDALRSRILFVSGKGGVGKSLVAESLSRAFAQSGLRTLWITFEDPTRPLGETRPISDRLTYLNTEALTAFEEYMGMKIGVPALTHFFVHNKVIRYLAKAAPGLQELVLLGKVWHERLNYDRVVVDMPSTGHGVAMFQSTVNFARLFQGGPLHRDAEAMLASFSDPSESAQIIVGLPEEMPLRESLELEDFLLNLFPNNPAAFIANKRFPGAIGAVAEDPDNWSTPVAASALDYVRKRRRLEAFNLRIWEEAGIRYENLPYFLKDAVNSAAARLKPMIPSGGVA